MEEGAAEQGPRDRGSSLASARMPRLSWSAAIRVREAMDDATWMTRALALAERGRRTVSPNPMVGCVLVREGEVVGEGWHERAGTPHAEVHALAAAGARARGATAYVTLEPCAHTGRTGPCTQALIDAGIAEVVLALRDPNPEAAGGAAVLREAGVRIREGVGREEARRQNAVFLHGVAHRRPYLLAKAAVSLDGRIAAADGTSQWLTGPEARQRAHALRAEVDAVVVGSGTVLADDPALTCRLEGYEGPQPLRVVLDGRARTPATAAVTDGAHPTLVLTREPAALPAAVAERVEAVAVDPGKDGSGLDPPGVLEVLWERDVRSALLEGGAAVLHGFLTAGLVDRLDVHVAPLLLGEAGRPLLAGPWAQTLADAPRLTLDAVERVGDDALLSLLPSDPEKKG